MALAAAYQDFLASPNASFLAENATLNYITTTTVIRGASEVIQHLTTLRRQIKNKKENVLSLVHGQSAIATEIETSFEFVTSGASYLPALDDNFLTDRTVTFPIMHIVTFDENDKIVNIRQSWDQGALLKQLDIMGRVGRNWPIRDSKDQIKMIENCVKSASGNGSTDSQSSATLPDRPQGKTAMRDPHASLSLFQSREELEATRSSVVSPRGGARPRQRDFVEILGDEPSDAPDSPSTGRPSIAPRGGARPRQRDFTEILGDEPVPDSPDANQGHFTPAPKAGAGKNFQPNRLFEADEEIPDSPPEDIQTPNRRYRPHPTKYSHFEFADAPDAKDAPAPVTDAMRVKTKHTSQWSFDDFVTPEKVKPSKGLRPQEALSANDDAAEKRPVQGKARREAESHFEFVEDGDNGIDRPIRPRGATQNNGHGLYQNNLFSDGNGVASTDGKQPLGAITNRKDRGRDFDAHWTLTDDPTPDKPVAKVSDDRQKAVKMMEANWDTYDESPVKKENKPAATKNGSAAGTERGIAIAGDGMGGGKGSNRDWFFG